MSASFIKGRVHFPCASQQQITQAGDATTLITLAPSGSAALAAGRLASQWTILLNRSALSHRRRLGGALSPHRLPFPALCLFISLDVSYSPLLCGFYFFHIFNPPPLVQILLSTCLLALRKCVLISSVTISCQLSLVKAENGVQIKVVFSIQTFIFNLPLVFGSAIIRI